MVGCIQSLAKATLLCSIDDNNELWLVEVAYYHHTSQQDIVYLTGQALAAMGIPFVWTKHLVSSDNRCIFQ